MKYNVFPFCNSFLVVDNSRSVQITRRMIAGYVFQLNYIPFGYYLHYEIPRTDNNNLRSPLVSLLMSVCRFSRLDTNTFSKILPLFSVACKVETKYRNRCQNNSRSKASNSLMEI